MELYEKILAKLLENEEVHITFPNLKVNPTEIIATESYQALKRIKEIIDDDSLSDEECFLKIEEIIILFEQWDGLDGYRHDF